MNAFMFNVLIFTPMIPTAQPGTPINQHQLYQSGFLASRLPAISPASWPGALWWALHLKALPVHPAPVNKKPRPHLATDCTCSPSLSTNIYSSGSSGSGSSNLRTAQVWRSNLASVCDFNHKQKAQTEGKLLCRQQEEAMTVVATKAVVV